MPVIVKVLTRATEAVVVTDSGAWERAGVSLNPGAPRVLYLIYVSWISRAKIQGATHTRTEDYGNSHSDHAGLLSCSHTKYKSPRTIYIYVYDECYHKR